MRLFGIAAGLGLLLAASAPAAAASGKAGSKYDPNRWICKSRPVIGSRLERVRECHSAQQWEELKRSEQLGLMRKQINGDPGCSGGHSESCHPMGAHDTPW